LILGVGLDLIEIERAERLLAGKGDRALARLLTAREIAYVRRRAVAGPSLAARLAAKEAAFKALSGTEEARGIGWREIEVERDPDGRPRLRLHGRAEARAAELGVRRIHVTLTHTHSTAAAVVVLEGQ
jgi:holo-[acyl-carrier protein] synthase